EIATPAPLNEPPFAGTLLTVSKSRVASKSQITSPVFEAYARRCPDNEPSKTTPGIAETAAERNLRDGSVAGVSPTFSPVSARNAYIPGVPPGPLSPTAA